jgi:hypothetical protein
MRSIAIIVGLAASAATAAVLPDAPLPSAPLPIGEIGWEGVVIPGEPAVEVWGASFEVNRPAPYASTRMAVTLTRAA